MAEKKDNIIKQVCKELGITQKELAERIGIHEVTIRKWSSSGEIPEWGIKFLELLLENKRQMEIINNLKIFKSTLQKI